ncbi:DUF5625 family protein [Rhodocyclus tenuis]|uniref:DUF5625 family protein n=1 Tax=Rhodocyclus tenuis TaxID=1066 RepID=UPI0019043471|nr:DUF5625 family protein [Rhodocyclus tenuis]
MARFCVQHWKLIAILAFFVIWITAFPIWSRWVSADPLNTAISLSPPGAIEKKINIPIPENYSFNLIFDRNAIEFEQLKKLVGEMGICTVAEQCSKGIPVPVQWVMKNADTGEITTSGEVESQDSSGWARAHVYRHLGNIRVPPGRYTFTAKVLRPVPELAHITTRIAIQIQPKSATTWQMVLVWWGSICQYLFAWPAAVLATILLLWRAGLTLRPRGTPANGRPLP